MDDAAALRRTVRRCTAAVVVAIGAATMALARTGSEIFGPFLVATGLLYLTGSFVVVSEQRADDERPG